MENEGTNTVSNTEVPPTDTASDLEQTLRTKLLAEYEERFKVWQTKEFAEYKLEQNENLKIAVASYIKEQEDAKRPLSKDEIQMLLSQEYLEFNVSVKTPEKKTYDFVISELPQDAERQFYEYFKKTVNDHATDLAAIAQESMDVSMDKKIQHVLEAVVGAFDILPKTVAIILKYGNKDPELTVTSAWVSANISSHRQWSICRAQAEVNKLRDFFSNVFRDGKQATTSLMPANTQL